MADWLRSTREKRKGAAPAVLVGIATPLLAFGAQSMRLLMSVFHQRVRRATHRVLDALHGSQRANQHLTQVVKERRLFAALVDNCSDFIGIADEHGNPLYLNPAGRKMIGLAADDPIAHTTIPEYYPPAERAFACDVILKEMRENGHWQGETYFRHWQSGKAIPVSDTHFMIREPGTGRLLGMSTISRDISQVKRAREEAEAARRKLERANLELVRLYEKTKELDVLKTQFFASVSHELRTPLTLILGPAQRLLEEPQLPDRARDDLEVISRNARTLLGRVNDLLDVAKLEAGRMPMEYATTDVTRLARYVASHFDALAVEKELVYAVDVRDGVRAEVDPDKVGRVLLNVLSNAFKFTPNGGNVRVSVRSEEHAFVVEVADSGPGIPTDKRAEIFEHFRQLECHTPQQPGGTGLGLAIARDFVALHGGRISVQTAPEGGALVIAVLPLRAPDGAFVRPVAESPELDDVRHAVMDLRTRARTTVASNAAPGRGTVLVVEDNPDMNRFIAESLSDTYRVEVAFDGNEGLTKALEINPDLVVVDIMMPTMSGDELVRAIRQRHELDGMPIVVLSAKADDALRVALLREGAQDYLTKPFSSEELRARVSNLVTRKHAEARVQQAEAKFRGIVSIAADAIVSVDEEQRIVLYNKGAEEIFGYTPEEILGKSLDLLLPERFRQSHRRHLRAFGEGSTRSRRMGDRRPELIGLRKNREEFLAEAAISKIEVGGTILMTAILRDVTERKRIETEQRFLAECSAALGSSLDMREMLTNVADVAVRQYADCTIVNFSGETGAAKRLLVAHADPTKRELCSVLEGIRLDLASLLRDTERPFDPVLLTDIGPELLESAAQNPEHLRALRELEPQSAMIVPLEVHGTSFGTLAFVSTRPSRRYRSEDLLFATEVGRRTALALENSRLYAAARRATQARDDVLGVVAHDLRNPLGAISIQAQLLRRRGAAEPGGHSQRAVEAIERAAARMNRLIQDLLDVGRVEAGRLSVERARHSVERIVSDAVDAQRALACSSSLDLRFDVPRELEVSADRDRLLQVFENLIGNAAKFTTPPGAIAVGARARDGDTLFWVTDSGVGIAADDLPHLFDRFWQGKQRPRHGAGLGLPIVKGIVEAHGGRVWVESTPGRGSTFYFTIPTAAPAVAGSTSHPV